MLRAHKKALAATKPGVKWMDVHLLACRSLAEDLKAIGCMKGDLDEAVREGAHAMFFQCGLGHMMGLDVHDMEGLGEQYVGYDDTVHAQHAVRPQVAADGPRARAGLRDDRRAGHLHDPDADGQVEGRRASSPTS